MFSFQSSRRNRGFRSSYGADASASRATSVAASEGTKQAGALLTAAVNAYRDVEIARITKQAPSTGVTSLAPAPVSRGGAGGGTELSPLVIAGIGLGIVAVGGAAYYLLRK